MIEAAQFNNRGGSLMTPTPVTPIILYREDIGVSEYEELVDSPKETFTEKGATVVRDILTPWSNRINLATKFKGRSRYDGKNWFYTPPQEWPDIPQAEVTTVDIKPFDEKPFRQNNDRRFAGYKMAQLTVKYQTPDSSTEEQQDDNGEELLVSEDIEPHGEFITLPYNKFFWKDHTPIAETEAPSRVIRTFTWVYTRHKMQAIPSFMLDFIGTVNEHEVTSKTLRFNFAAETLLFDEPRLSRDITTLGVKAWRVTMRMIYRPYTWQKFWRAGMDEPEYLYLRQLINPNVVPSKTDPNPDQYYTDRIFKPYKTNEFGLITGGAVPVS